MLVRIPNRDYTLYRSKYCIRFTENLENGAPTTSYIYLFPTSGFTDDGTYAYRIMSISVKEDVCSEWSRLKITCFSICHIFVARA